MTYKWHIIGGALAYSFVLLGLSVLSFSISLDSSILWFFISIFGALFPDIDTQSKIRRLLYGKWLFVLFGILILLKTSSMVLIFLTFLAILPFVAKHRGFFHSIFLLVGLPVTLSITLSWYYPAQAYVIITSSIFFIAGALSHVLLDKL